MTKLVIMLPSVDDKTGNNAAFSRWQLVIMLFLVNDKVVIMLSSVDDKTGNNVTFSRWQNW